MDSCGGDSGGPLVCKLKFPKSQEFTLMGIVSYGDIACEGKPGNARYVSVPYMLDWIKDSLKEYIGT